MILKERKPRPRILKFSNRTEITWDSETIDQLGDIFLAHPSRIIWDKCAMKLDKSSGEQLGKFRFWTYGDIYTSSIKVVLGVPCF